MAGLRETLNELRQHWNAFAENHAAALGDFNGNVTRLIGQAGELGIPALARLAQSLKEASAGMVALGDDARDAVRLEIATTLLFLQNATASEDLFEPDFPLRADGQVRRIKAALAGHAESGAEDLLDEGSRKASEHALLAQLGREIGGSLRQIEEGLDAFFRDASQRDALSALEGLTSQIHGALAILDQDEASELLTKAMALVHPYLQAGSPNDAEKVKVADAVSSLGLFVEAHCAGRADAARILRPARIAFGLAEPDSAETGYLSTVEDGLEARKALVAASYLDWQNGGGDDTQKKCLAALTELGHDADLIADSALKAAVAHAVNLVGTGTPDSRLAAAITQLTGHDIAFVPAPLTLEPARVPVEDLAPDQPTPVDEPAVTPFDACAATPEPEICLPDPQDLPQSTTVAGDLPVEPVVSAMADEAAVAPPAEDGPEIDPELLAIFLEEAGEVLHTLEQAAMACQADPNDRESLTVLRRAFHTLKGSGRMVGLMAFGEAAWGMEQLLNTWLADEKAASADFLAVTGDAHALFAAWVERLQADSRAHLSADALLARAAFVARGEPLPAVTTTAAELDMSPPYADEAVRETDVTSDAAEPAAEDELPAPPEEILVAGVSLSPGLYRVFKDESAYWSATLREERARLDEAETYVVSEPARRGVHTLAGIAGTTGFPALAELAHAIEIYLKELEDRPLPHHARPVLGDALARVADMIDNIHAGASPLPAEALIRALAGLQLEEYLPALPTEEAFQAEAIAPVEDLVPEAAARDSEWQVAFTSDAGAEAGEFSAVTVDSAAIVDDTSSMPAAIDEACLQEADLDEPAPADAEAMAADPAAVPFDIGVTVEDMPPAPIAADLAVPGANDDAAAPNDTDDIAAGMAPAPADAEAPLEELIAQAKRQASTPVFEQRQVRDEIDADLLPIFLEEAEALIPQAAENLRQWKAQPAVSQFPAELRRVLHTIKGSARMAGAMRLGELTHIMESRVIAVLEGELSADTGVFETLENQYDRMANDVDRLRAGLAAPEVSQFETEAAAVGVVLPPEEAPAPATGPQPATPLSTTQPSPAPTVAAAESTVLRVRSEWVDRMVNEAGEVAIARSRIETEMHSLKRQVSELSEALRRLKDHLREVEIQAEAQMQATFQSHGGKGDFDPLEFDRFTRFQEVTRFLAESVHDISTIQQNLAVQLGEADAALIQQARMNRELQQNLLRVRMVPLNSVSERLYRVVRQAGRDLNKRAQLDIRNGELELDRGVLEKIVAPLEHLLRNAVAHGLEAPDTRRAAGKPEFGDIRIDARQEGNEMVLRVMDDGAGLNLQRIREKALAQNLLSPGMEPSDQQLAQMIFVPGFSTAGEVSEIAGRGVGMDVVKSEISSLGGRVEIASEAGKGVTFSIYLPLTLAVTQAVIVLANKEEYALPATMVEQVQELKPDHLAAAMQAQAIEWRGHRYPLFYLPHLLGQTDAVHELQRFNTVVLMRSGSSHAALLVDVVEGAREIVVKNIGPQLARLTGIAGATVRGDGGVMLILNPVPLAARALREPAVMPDAAAAQPQPPQETSQAPLVMVVDDSLTVRKISSRLLVREGYRVDTAKDGVEALEKMQDLIPNAVLLDVEMPRMDGFELARVMRNDPRLKAVPIIMITSRTADKHRNHALEIGVNIYLGKPFQEAVLLEHLHALLADKLAAVY
jgi:chemosensory pili system protein ChpA (sensor histidine kinase/response regulator)